MALKDFLVMLAGGGAAVAFSFIVERIEAWHKLSAGARQWISFGGSSVLALGALAIVTYVPADVLTALGPWFAVVAGTFVAFFMNQAAHSVDPARISRAAAELAAPVAEVAADLSAAPMGGFPRAPR